MPFSPLPVRNRCQNLLHEEPKRANINYDWQPSGKSWLYMVYVPGVTYDIFVSYPRENNVVDPRGVRWVSDFCNHLQAVLNQRISSVDKPEIFFDERNYESGQELESLLQKARESAVILAIVSPAFVARGKFTLKELSAYCDAHAKDERVVITVYYLSIENEYRTPELQAPHRREFFRKNESGVEIPLASGDDDYMSRIHTVAQQIKNRLDELRDKRGQVVQDIKQGPILGKTVLLTQVTDDLLDTAEEVRGYIEKLGATVLPQAEYPVWGPEFVDSFKSNLKDADLVVQLLSRVRSQKRDGEGFSCAQFQYSTARDWGKELMLWRDPSDISKVQHYDKGILESASAMGLEEFKASIWKKLETMSRSKSTPAESGGAAKSEPFIYIATDEGDLARAFELKKVVEQHGAARIMEENDKLNDFKQQVPDAEAVIFLYGNAPREFIDSWLDTYRRLKSTEQPRKTARMEAVYYAPPPKTVERQLRNGWSGLREFGSQENFTTEAMQDFLSALRRSVER